ncbi:MAG: hypothetical protein U1F16_15430 [Turneriella sp.]
MTIITLCLKKNSKYIFPMLSFFLSIGLGVGCLRYTPDPYRYVRAGQDLNATGQVMRSYYSQMSQINDLGTRMEGVPMRFFLAPGPYTFTLMPTFYRMRVVGTPQVKVELKARQLLVVCSNLLEGKYISYTLSIEDYPKFDDDDFTGDNSCDMHYAIVFGKPFPQKFTQPSESGNAVEIIPELRDKTGKSIYELAVERKNYQAIQWIETKYPRVKPVRK